MSKGEETRSAVLGHAIALASELGLEGVTIGLLADRAGMSKSGLFAHVKSKEALQLAILEETLARFVARVVLPALKKPRGEPRVRALFEGWLEFAHGMTGGCIIVQSMAELDDRPGVVRDRLESAQRDWLDTLATAVRIAKEEGHFEARVVPEQLAYEIASLTYGHHLLSRMLRDRDADGRVRLAFDRMVRAARGAAD